MHTHRVRRIPVIDGDHQVGGIVTLEDVLVLLGEEVSDMGRTVSESFCGNRSQQTRRRMVRGGIRLIDCF